MVDFLHPADDPAALWLPPAPLGVPEPDLAVAPVGDVPRAQTTDDLLTGFMVGAGDTVSLVLDGAVDVRLAPDLKEMLATVRSSGVQHLVLELGTVTFMDTTGLRFLFDLQRLAEERGGSLRLADPSEAVLDLLEMSGAAEALGLPAGPTGTWPGALPA